MRKTCLVVARPRKRDEHGAYLVIWALLLVGLLTMVAIVIDLGQVRDTKRHTRLIADFGALAAGPQLAGLVSSGALVVDAPAACQDAFSNIKANTPDLPPSDMSRGDGCSGLPKPCTNPASGVPGTTPVDAVARLTAGGGLPDPYRITIRYPVLDSDIADTLSPSARPTDGKPCERMRVSIERSRTTFFGGVAGVRSLTARASAVIRGYGSITPTQVPALLLLERVGCDVLHRNSKAGNSRLVVYASDPDNPGTIQADSLGISSILTSASNCDKSGPGTKDIQNIAWAEPTGDNLPGVEIRDCVYVPPLKTCADPVPSAPDPGGTFRTPGRLGLHAIEADSKYRAYRMETPCPGNTCGIQATLGTSKLASRKVVDNKYLAEVKLLKTSSDAVLDTVNTPAGRTAILAACGTAGAGTAPYCGFKLYPDDYAVACGDSGGPITDAKVLITCNLSTVPSSLVFSSSTPAHYVVAGSITVKNGSTVSFRNVAEMLVVGCSTDKPVTTDTGASITCGGATSGTNIGLSVPRDAKLLINNNPVSADIPGTCPASTLSYSPAVLVIRSGRLDVAGSLTACQVFLYMSGVKPAASRISQDDSGDTDSTCTPEFPCPRDNDAYGGYVTIQGQMTWLAPNVNTTTSRDPLDSNQRFEDLAIWDEVGLKDPTNSIIKGGGASAFDTTGVFYFPNQTFELQGSGTASPHDAQFLARRLFLSGSTTFAMRPSPQNSIGTPKSSFTLIR